MTVLGGCSKNESVEERSSENQIVNHTQNSTKNRIVADDHKNLSVTKKQQVANSPSKRKKLKKGTPEWLVREIFITRIGRKVETDDVNVLKKLRRKRNLEIVQLAEDAISLTKDEPSKQKLFQTAVRQLMQSRIELAMQGSQSEIDELYALADVLYRRDPNSKVAADAAFDIAYFANRKATESEKPNTHWLDEFLRNAQVFARRFPHEERRAIQLLDAAGKSCEYYHNTQAAMRCYIQLRKQFPDSEQAKYAVAILRRLSLKGNPLQLGGPTIDGGEFQIERLKGKIVLVVFWDSHSGKFQKQLNPLKQTIARYRNVGLKVVGVNLDEKEIDVDRFLEKWSLDWPQIFPAAIEKRRWNHPVANYYAIRNVPTYWLVDRRGIVVETNLQPQQLDGFIRKLRTQTAQNSKSSHH